MPKFRIDVEQGDLQMIFSLMAQGYNDLLARISKQLEAGPITEPPPVVQVKQPQAGNG